MASLTVRDLDESTKERLRVRAARRGRSMEAEAREILREAVTADDADGENLVDAIRGRFASVGGVTLRVPPRDPIREPPRFK